MSAPTKKMSKTRRSDFTHEEEILLIEFIKKNTRLYDGSYSSPNEKLQLWKKIGADLSKTGEDYMYPYDTSISFILFRENS